MKSCPVDEASLVVAAKSGDLEAFNLLVVKYQDMLFRISLRIIRDELGAEDATQYALIQAYKSLHSFRGGSFRSWLVRIAVNASYDELRREKRHISQALEQFNAEGEEIESPTWMEDLSAGPHELAETSEVNRALQQCIRNLIPDYRLMVILVDIEGLSYEEAARVTRVPVGTVKSRLARARMQLRSSLRKFEEILPTAYQVELPKFAHA